MSHFEIYRYTATASFNLPLISHLPHATSNGMKIIRMAFLLSSPRASSAFSFAISSRRQLCKRNGISRSSASSIYEDDLPSKNIAAQDTSTQRPLPYFPIYYNDVYEVDLPKGHRFPMEKYRRVRLALQDRIISDELQHRVICGE